MISRCRDGLRQRKMSTTVILFSWFAVLGFWAITKRDRLYTALLMIGGMYMAWMIVIPIMLDFMSRVVTVRHDLLLFRADMVLGFSISYWLSQLALQHRWLFWFLLAVYQACGGIMFLVFSAYYLRNDKTSKLVAFAFAVNFFIGCSLYFLLPASGPLYMFPGYPYAAPPTGLLSSSIFAPNCMPSLHMSTVLLILAFCWRWRIARLLAGLLVTLTIVATLALGEHYLIDLIVGVPYAAFVYLLVTRRYVLAGLNLFLVLLWITVLRQGIEFVPSLFIVFCGISIEFGVLSMWLRSCSVSATRIYFRANESELLNLRLEKRPTSGSRLRSEVGLRTY
jgi:hypothetical protein